MTWIEFLCLYRQIGELPLTKKGLEDFFERNKKIREEIERLYKEDVAKNAEYYKYPTIEDECFKK